MGDLFTSLFAKVAAVIKWFSDLFVSVFVALWDVVKDGFSWLFDQVLQVAVSAVNGLDVSALSSVSMQAGSLPGEILNILQLIGVGTAVSIITAAIGIRLLLQLVPFTRLGS